MAQKNAPLLQQIRHLFADGANAAIGAIDKIVAYAEMGESNEDISYNRITEQQIEQSHEHGHTANFYFCYSAVQNAVLGLDCTAQVSLALKYEQINNNTKI